MQSLLENPFQLQSPVTEKAFVRGVINKHIMRAVDQIRRKKRDLGSETPIGPGGLDAIPKQNMKDMRRVSRKPKRRKPGPIVDPSVPREPDIGTKLPSSRKHMHPSRMTPLSAAEQLEGYHKLLKRLPEDQMRTIARCLGEDMADSEIAARLGLPTAAVRAKILEIRQLLESKAPLRRKPKEPGPAGEDD
jgi:DNA-directed RNA polymerase specialized sigma24 family protein